jgi:DNA polymerase IV
MRREGFAERALAVWFTDRNTAGWFGEERFAPVFDDRSILMSLGKLFTTARHTGAPLGGRSLHVVLHDLVPAGEVARDLFEFAPELRRRRRWEHLSLLTDRLNARYGRAVVNVGPWVEPPGGYAGAKIAFNRIPDEADF